MTAVNLVTADLFHAEIARLQAEIDRLRAQPCPHVTGSVTRYCTLTPLTLTDVEREAIKVCESDYSDNDMDAGCWQIAATLRGLLERTETVAE